MAEKAEKKSEAVYESIENLKIKRSTPNAVFEGAKAFKNWHEGKQVTEAEYDKAIDEFKKTPADGRGVKR